VPYNAKLLEVEKEHQYRFIVNEVGKKVMLPLDLEKRWNDTVKAASILKNGGYRVLINGKPHHVEGRR
jgi:predicted TIM-barrel enzyme